jgi:TonB family protein
LRKTSTAPFRAIIRSDGSVDGVRVLEGVDERLNENARRALEKWHFRPGTNDGQPIDIEAVVRVPFRVPGVRSSGECTRNSRVIKMNLFYSCFIRVHSRLILFRRGHAGHALNRLINLGMGTNFVVVTVRNLLQRKIPRIHLRNPAFANNDLMK